MIEANDFVTAAGRRGFDFYTGVPCSILTPFINHVSSTPSLCYLPAANEGDAVATAAGAWIGGRRSIAMLQNSGLGNAVSPLTSLTHTFGIPVLLICTHRGAPGVPDEPQHALMGEVTGALLDVMRVPWAPFPTEATSIEAALESADAEMRVTPAPFAFLMPKGACAPATLRPPALADRQRASLVEGAQHRRPQTGRPSRHAVLVEIVARTPLASTVLVATTGFTGRELYAVADRANHLYVVGSMGCASSLGLGLALARPDLTVVVLDGDGAALMRMGNLATIGACGPANLTHVLLDNEVHESTGGQATVSAHIDFAGVAVACGYARVVRTDSLDDLTGILTTKAGPVFVHLKVRPGIPEHLPRPAESPDTVLHRLRAHIRP